MSHFSQVRDLLKHNQQQHSQIAQFYAGLAAQTSNPRAAMLLTTLHQHETQLASELNRYLQTGCDNVLNTFFQYDHEHSVQSLMQVEDAEFTTEDEVISLASRIDEYFLQLYEEMREAVEHSEVRDMFENLAQHITEEKKRLSTDIYSLQDI
ncbi:hypothetical protein [Pseudobowmanella zhangzhouensis]|uniref:DUF2383 domain-containing protein n=1 Tax=Pseudobowmanella zhangzhouensis TaxID=1537679 RepID=A0ABW1XNJ6_9ALTE